MTGLNCPEACLTFSGTKLEARQKLGKLSVIRASLVAQTAKAVPAVRSWSCEDGCHWVIVWLPGPVASDSDLTAYKYDSPCGGHLGPVTSDGGLVSLAGCYTLYVRILFLYMVWLLYVPIFSLQWGNADRNFAHAKHGTNRYRCAVYICNGILLSH